MIEVELIGGEQAVVRMGAEMRAYLAAVRDAVKKVGIGNEAAIKTGKLSGQVLNRRSGRLSAGVHTDFTFTDTEASAATGIGPDLQYGKHHEYGGTFPVKSHMRVIRMAWGRPIAPKEIRVREYTLTLPQRSWLRSAFKERAERNIETVRNAVREVKK